VSLPDISIQEIRVISDGGLQVAYYHANADIKKNGVIHLHNLIVPEGDQYDDEIRAVIDAAVYFVRDVLEDLPDMPNEHPRDE
jgi:hypothetical protein